MNGNRSRARVGISILASAVVVLVIVGGVTWQGNPSDRSSYRPSPLTARARPAEVSQRAPASIPSAQPATQPLVVTIPAGLKPTGVTYDSDNGNVYVANQDSGNISVINGTSNKVMDSISVGPCPYGEAFDAATGDVYIANTGGGCSSDNITVIDAANNSVAGSITVGANPVDLAYDSANGYIYVVQPNSNSLTVIDGSTDEVVGSVAVQNPYDVAFDSANGYLYVTNETSGGYVTVIDGSNDEFVASIPVGGTPVGVAVDSSNGCIYVTNDVSEDNGYVDVVNGSSGSVVGHTDPSQPAVDTLNIAFDSADGYVYVMDAADNVTEIDGATNEVVASIPIDSTGWGAAADPANGFVYVGNLASGTVTAINAGSSFVANPSLVDAGVATSFNVTGAGGEGTLSYDYTGLPSGCTTSDTATLSCTPTRSGVFTIRVFVNDSGGSEGTATAQLTVNPAPSSVSLNATPRPTDALAPVTFNATVSGGTAPIQYTWLFGDGTNGTGRSISHAFTSAGNYTVRVTAKDSFGLSATNTLSMRVYPELLASLTVSNSTPLLGQTVAFISSATGGLGPYSYTYTGFPPGCVSEDRPAVGCLPTQADEYNVTVQIRDQNNVTANSTVTMRVIFDFNVVVPSNTSVGSPFTISVNTNETFSGGTAVVPAAGFGTFTYNYSGLPPGCASMDAASITCTPTQVGTYHITIGVHDQAGDHQTHTVVVNVVPARSTPGFLGLSGDTGYFVIGAIVAAAAVLVGVLAFRRRSRPHPSTPSEKEEGGAGGKGPTADRTAQLAKTAT